MKPKREIVYTHQAFNSLNESLNLLKDKVNVQKIKEIRKQILDKVEILATHPESGQIEEFLLELNQGHRRIIYTHYKIIYLSAKDKIIITDIFDTRQDPNKMKA
ncbi:MAG: type II toxin-antitoxin system RelE/ParE family toxin [Chitinophagaceae bacterium]|nr:MAG: type II toxin-antitoxin system RelE/ParE family toxin [Chitinophagaceae bacterium]